MTEQIVDIEDDDFLSQVAAAEADALSAKRRKITATTTVTPTTAAATTNLPKAVKKEAAASAEGAYTAALRGSRSLVFQQPSSGGASDRFKAAVTDSHKVFAKPESSGGGSTGGVGEGSCFKCGKQGHWARDCDTNVDALVPLKACPCGLGSCMVLTANTEKNRGRKFYRCPVTEENGGCRFFEWCDRNIGTDSTSVRSHSFASKPSFPDLSCPCGAGSCLILTAKTGKNVGQSFYRCPANQESTCGFFKWCQDHTVPDSLPALVNNSKVNKTNEMSDKSFVKRSGSSCFRCGQDGHWAKDCASRHDLQTQHR